MGIKKINYDEIQNSIKTGDLVLFHGTMPASELTELLQVSKWSHVAMAIRPKDIGLDYPDLLLWESNTLKNLKDVKLNKGKTGPMLVNLRERILTDIEEGYDDLFQVRYLDPGLLANDTRDMHTKLKTFIETVHLDNYPKSERQAFTDFLEGHFLQRDPNPKDYFCSELIAATYIHMGLLTKDFVANSYLPKDFSDKAALPLLQRAYLTNGPYIEVK